MASTTWEGQSEDPEAIRRRDFLKLTFLAGLAATVIASASVARYLTFIPAPGTSPTDPTGTPRLEWPRIRIANINSLQSMNPVIFNYPLINTANLLVRLGTRSENGVGPDGDIVAYSMICQHLGYFMGFVPPGETPSCNANFSAPVAEGYCCAHGGQYDFTRGAAVIGGPPPRPVPSVVLEFDETTGDIYAVAMRAPTIFGHGTPGTTDPALVLRYDLQGGEVVTQDTVFPV